MALRNTTPVRFSPAGLSDTLDATEEFPGAMASLSNLIPDPSTKHLWVCRPGAISRGNTAGSKFVSACIVVGDRVYGMVGSNTNAGKDEPFCFNLLTNSLLSISGIVLGNSPTSLATTGDWVPPSMDVVGTKIMVAHQGFIGSGDYIGWIDISNPAALTWSAGNTSGNALAYPPTAVKQFGNRAYYAVNPPSGSPSLVYSDVLVPTNITNSSQALQFGDNVPITALGALPLSSQLSGIIQALIVFKGASNMWQVTGDAALNNLSQNSLSVATGTLAPNTICPTTQGLAFMSPDGVRYINFQGVVSDPVGVSGDGVTVPFVYAVYPSRAVASCNAAIYRISVQNSKASGSPWQEYWFDIARKIWTGPHTFPASQIKPYNNTFVEFPVAVTGGIFTSDIALQSGSVFVENGASLMWTWQTSMLPDPGVMSQMSMVETTLNMALQAGGGNINIAALDGNGSTLASCIVSSPGTASYWGTMVWGVNLWLGAYTALQPRRCKWPVPVEFRRLAIKASGQSVSGVQIGDLFMRYQLLKYLQEPLV